MPRLPLFLLLASAAMPAVAAAQDDDRRDRRNRAESTEQSESQPQHGFQNRRATDGEQRLGAERPEPSERVQESRRGASESMREQIRQQREQRIQAASAQSGSDDEGVRSPRRGDRDGSAASSGWRPRERAIRTIPDTQSTVATQGGRGGGDIARAFEGRARRDYRDGNYRRWTDNWRHDRRYDWRRWRDSHRSLFRLGGYYDPFGWSYRRWSLGSFLFPSYYGSRYWLNDPWHYRLPPAYGPYRWVRYWDDAIMVNIYTGEVVDVIHNFFW